MNGSQEVIVSRTYEFPEQSKELSLTRSWVMLGKLFHPSGIPVATTIIDGIM